MTLLTQEQAEAVYGAMVHLNTVGGIIYARIPLTWSGVGRHIIVMKEIMSDDIVVTLNVGGADQSSERYANQNSFAAAYGLD